MQTLEDLDLERRTPEEEVVEVAERRSEEGETRSEEELSMVLGT